ncbi:hypothetical protein OG985_05310 [Streptomyces sp. NBC_00289]|uniref:hypothetical protein n=1 Tax=Streptomyces sp. NBC_00289 TaxID=2975703 RepID=UPI00324F1D1A
MLAVDFRLGGWSPAPDPGSGITYEVSVGANADGGAEDADCWNDIEVSRGSRPGRHLSSVDSRVFTGLWLTVASPRPIPSTLWARRGKGIE